MEDLKKLTVRYLRELARKHLGSGYSKHTREQLIEALKQRLPDFLKGAIKGQGAVARKSSVARSRVDRSQEKPHRIESKEGKGGGAKRSRDNRTAASNVEVKPAEVKVTPIPPARAAPSSPAKPGARPGTAKPPKSVTREQVPVARVSERVVSTSPQNAGTPGPVIVARSTKHPGSSKRRKPGRKPAGGESPGRPVEEPRKPAAPVRAAEQPPVPAEPRPPEAEAPAARLPLTPIEVIQFQEKASRKLRLSASPSLEAKVPSPVASPTATRAPPAAPPAPAEPAVPPVPPAPAVAPAAPVLVAPAVPPAAPASIATPPALLGPPPAAGGRSPPVPPGRSEPPGPPPRGEGPPRRRRPTSATPPITEGFFVARLGGEEAEVRQHPGSRPAPVVRRDEEGLGELPSHDDDDSTVLMARDPRTLFVFWSFSSRTLTSAAYEIDSPEPRLRIYEGDALIREEPFDLQARNHYLRELPAGRTFRVELHLVGRNGRWVRLGPPSNPVMLPRQGPSSDTQIRFMRVDPEAPQVQLEEVIRSGESEELEGEPRFVSWDRIRLPGSAEDQRGRQEVGRRRRVAPPGPPGPEGAGPVPSGAGLERGWAPSPSGQGRGWAPGPSGQGRGGRGSGQR